MSKPSPVRAPGHHAESFPLKLIPTAPIPMPPLPFDLSVKSILLDLDGRCLLLRRSAANLSDAGCWEWPGGKVEAGESFTAALAREAREEAGLEIELTGVAGVTEFAAPQVRVVLLCMEARVTGGKLRLGEEHDDAAWVPLEEVGQRALPARIRDFMVGYAGRKGTS